MPQSTQLRSISWRDVCPWLLLVRAFSLAVSPTVLILGTVAALLIPVGWQVGEQVFLTEADREAPALRRVAAYWAVLPGVRGVDDQNNPWPETTDPSTWFAPVRVQTARLGDIALGMANSLADADVRRVAYFVMGLLWTLFVAALFGGAISRKSVVALGREESLGLSAALRHAWKNLTAYMLAPLYPLVMILLIALLAAGLGLAMRVGVLALLASLIWFLALAGGAIAAMLLLGLLIGWPLMWGAVSAEQDGEAFEALSRSYSYVLGRPLNLLFYAVFAALIGSLGLIVVSLFCDLTIAFAAGPANWGSDGKLSDMLAGDNQWLFRTAGAIVGVQNQIVRTIQAGYQFGFFWAAAAGVYLLLRSDVDHTELDEVFVEEEAETLSLPSLQRDTSGAVTVKEDS